jgi:SAM-dependent methyltransferase
MQYDALAPLYDRLMGHVEYEEWAEFVVKAAARFGEGRRTEILEIGAGTGVVGAMLRKMGYSYIASDISFSMCKIANVNRNLPVCVADARHLPFKKKFGMALFLYDGINYLMTQEDYRKLFAAVFDVLAPGGLFLFDITTRENSMRHFMHYLDFEDYGDFSYVRESYFDVKKSIQHNDFTIHRRSDENPDYYEKYTEAHRQKVFSVLEIEGMVPKKRFAVLGIWDGYSFRKYTGRSLRVHFLLRKI